MEEKAMVKWGKSAGWEWESVVGPCYKQAYGLRAEQKSGWERPGRNRRTGDRACDPRPRTERGKSRKEE
jgi:hypothetical protein